MLQATKSTVKYIAKQNYFPMVDADAYFWDLWKTCFWCRCTRKLLLCHPRFSILYKISIFWSTVADLSTTKTITVAVEVKCFVKYATGQKCRQLKINFTASETDFNTTCDWVFIQTGLHSHISIPYPFHIHSHISIVLWSKLFCQWMQSYTTHF